MRVYSGDRPCSIVRENGVGEHETSKNEWNKSSTTAGIRVKQLNKAGGV